MSTRIVTAGIVIGLVACSAGCDRRIDVDFNFAIEEGDFEMADEWLEQGADIDARFKLSQGYTTLMMVARKEWEPETIEFLLERGADVNVRTFNGRTALYVAAANGRTQHVRMLLEAGADVNLRNQAGDTAMKAAHDDNHTIAEQMIRAAGGRY